MVWCKKCGRYAEYFRIIYEDGKISYICLECDKDGRDGDDEDKTDATER